MGSTREASTAEQVGARDVPHREHATASLIQENTWVLYEK